MKILSFVLVNLFLIGCTNYQQYPIYNTPHGIIETIKIKPITDTQHKVIKRIRTTSQLYKLDFSGLLMNQLYEHGELLCLSGVKGIDSDYQKIITLDYVTSENTRVRHRIEATINCN